MGCVCLISKPTLRKSNGKPKEIGINLSRNERKSNLFNYDEKFTDECDHQEVIQSLKASKLLYHISPHNWLNVIDYLNYSELKEVGKINRIMKYMVRNAEILIKFFKNKNTKFIKKNHKSSQDKYEGVLSFPTFKTKNSKISIQDRSLSIQSLSGNVTQNGKNYFIHIPTKQDIRSNLLSIQTVNLNNNVEYDRNNPDICKQNLKSSINSQPGIYKDYFTQNEVDWNYIKRNMVNQDSKSLSREYTPTLSINNSVEHSNESKIVQAFQNSYKNYKISFKSKNIINTPQISILKSIPNSSLINITTGYTKTLNSKTDLQNINNKMSIILKTNKIRTNLINIGLSKSGPKIY